MAVLQRRRNVGMLSENRPLLIGLAGPSGAGKTTLAKHIAQKYPQVTHIRRDGFYKTLEEFPLFGKWINREAPENLKWDKFYRALVSLRAGQPTEFPVYEKKLDRCVGSELVAPSPIVIAEGYLLYHDPRIRELFDVKLFLHVSVDAQYQRKKSRWPEMDDDYFYQVVVPMFEMHGSHGARHAQDIFNGDVSEEEIIVQFENSPFVKTMLNTPSRAG